MYKGIDLPALQARAEEFLKVNDRAQFDEYFSLIEEFASNIEDREVYVGGDSALAMMGLKDPFKAFALELYCENAYDFAKSLTDFLFQSVSGVHIPRDTLQLKTNIKGRELTLSVDNREIAKIYNILRINREVAGTTIFDAFDCETFDALHNKNVRLKCVPTLFLLIGIYSKIKIVGDNTPDYGALMAIESQLFEKIFSKREVRDARKKSSDFNTIILQSLHQDYAIIGDAACGGNGRLQLLIEDQEAFLSDLRALLNQKNSVTLARIDHYIPNEYVMEKYTVSIGGEMVADLYNNLSFELVGRDISTHFAYFVTLLRFYCIEIWTLTIYKKRAGNDFLQNRINAITNKICELHEANKFEEDKFFSLVASDYAGSYADEAVAKKKFIRSLGVMIPPYLPAANQV